MTQMFTFSEYTNRLYSSPIRFIHAIRARQLVRMVTSNRNLLHARRILELGCSDLYFLTRFATAGLRPKEYVGVDVFWEETHVQARHNASILRERYSMDITLLNQPAELSSIKGRFDAVVALETLEHLEDETRVLDNLDAAIVRTGLLLISLPVEFGAMLLVKECARMLMKRKIQYSAGELAAAVLGQTTKVERVIGDHKGYDYRTTLYRLRTRLFTPIEEHLYPFRWPHLAYGYIGLWQKYS